MFMTRRTFSHQTCISTEYVTFQICTCSATPQRIRGFLRHHRQFPHNEIDKAAASEGLGDAEFGRLFGTLLYLGSLLTSLRDVPIKQSLEQRVNVR